MFFGKSRGITHGIAIDCGTSSVRAAVFMYAGSGPLVRPTVTRIIRVPFKHSGYMDAALLRRNTAHGLTAIIKQISTQNFADVCIGLSSPFYISKTSRVIEERPQHEKPITEQEFARVIHDASMAFSRDIEQRMPGERAMVFNTAAFAVHINGYRVENAVGMNGKLLELRTRFEGTSQDIYEDFNWRIRQIFPSARLRLVSIPTAMYTALDIVFDADKGFLILDMGGEVTELSLVVHGILEHVCFLPFGMNVFIRQLADSLKISLDDASFVMRRYAEHTLEQDRLEKLMPMWVAFQETLRQRVLRVVEICAKNYDLPSRVVFTGGGALAGYRTLWSDKFSESLAMRKNTTVSLATPNDLNEQFTKQSFAGPSDFGLAAVTLLCARGGL